MYHVAKRLTRGLAAAVLSVTLALVTGADAPASAPIGAQSPVQPLSPPVKVHVGSMGVATEAATFIGIERGYFRDEGLDVELVLFRSAPEMMPPLATGQIEFGGTGPDPSLFNALLRGVDVKMVGHNAKATEHDSVAALVVRQDLIGSGRYRTLGDLRGMNIAVPGQGGHAQFIVERILARGGLTLDDVQLTTIPFTDSVIALSNRAVDAAWAVEPFVTLSRAENVAQPVITSGDVIPGVIGGILLASPVLARENPEAVRRFVTAHLRGVRDYYRAFMLHDGSEPAIIDILVKYTAVKDPELQARIGHHGVDPNGDMDERTFEELQDAYLRYGTQQGRVDLSRLVDRQYLAYALERLGRMPTP